MKLISLIVAVSVMQDYNILSSMTVVITVISTIFSAVSYNSKTKNLSKYSMNTGISAIFDCAILIMLPLSMPRVCICYAFISLIFSLIQGATENP